MTFIQASNFCFDYYDHRWRDKSRWYDSTKCEKCRNFQDHKNVYCPCECGLCEIFNSVPRADLDFIETVERNAQDGQITHERRNIDVPYEFLKEISSTYLRKGSTLCDIQALLETRYPFIPGSEVNFCSPHCYGERYVDRYTVRKHVTLEEYNEWLENHTKEFAENFDKSNPEESRPTDYAEQKQRYVLGQLNMWRRKKKREYYVQVIRAIAQHHYKLKLNEIHGAIGNRLLAHSFCGIGKTIRNYAISPSIRLSFYSNFGYGASAAFWLILYYKDVPIVPFSYYVNYYFAKASDLCRYTREYYPRAESWESAFDFMAKVLNLERINDEEFVNKWIVGEIDTMMSGMEEIMARPKDSFDPWAAAAAHKNKRSYKSVRAVNGKEKKLYECYQNEMLLDFQAEKISGAFDLLESLSKLEGFYSGVKDHIARIRQMAREFHPQVKAGILRVEKDIERLDCEIKVKIKELETVRVRRSDEEKRIKTECGKAIEGIKDEKVRKSIWSARYRELTLEGSVVYILHVLEMKKEEELNELKEDRLYRKNFRERLVAFERAIDTEKGHGYVLPLEYKKKTGNNWGRTR